MNNIYKRFLGWGFCLTIGLTAVACSDDDDSPFAGTDAHIVSLTLTVADGTVYPVSIVNDTLLVSIPNNISLDGATATYELCELANILPDPTTVTNWNEEQIFRLVSYSGKEYANYKYVIDRKDVGSEGSVSLATQAEIDSFGEKGVTVVNGNLIIGSPYQTEDPVTTLKSLSSVTKVTGKLIILSSYEGESLEGLDNITELGGIMIGTEDTPSSYNAAIDINLPSVKKIGDVFINSNDIKTLKLPNISSASSINVTGSALEEVDLSNISNCSGEFSFGKNVLYDYNNSLKKLLCPKLQEVGGDFTLNYLQGLTTIDFKKVSKIGGNIKCAYLNVVEDFDFSSLSDFSGNLTLTYLMGAKNVLFPHIKNIGTYSVTGISDWAAEKVDFSSLETVSGALSQTAKLPNLDEFELPVLKSVGGNLAISTLSNITSLSLPELTSIGGTLSLSSMAGLESVSLPKLSSVKTTVSINLAAMSSLDISSLTSFTGMTFANVKKMEVLKFSEAIDAFPGTLSIANTCTSIKKIIGPKNYSKLVTVSIPYANVLPLGGGYEIPTFETYSGDLVTMYALNISGTRMESLSFSGVKEVSGQLRLPLCKELTLNDIEKAGSILGGSNSGLISKLSAPDLESVSGDFSFGYKGVDLFYIPKLTSIGNLILNGYGSSFANSTRTNLDDFSALRTITGNVTIQYQKALEDYTGLSGVKDFNGTWTVANNKKNITLEEFKALSK